VRTTTKSEHSSHEKELSAKLSENKWEQLSFSSNSVPPSSGAARHCIQNNLHLQLKRVRGDV
jgi:hypothetical protein